MNEYIIKLDRLGMQDVPRVGGKNASLGEMISNLTQLGVRVPGGFATTADAFRDFLAQNYLRDRIEHSLRDLDTDDVNALTETGANIRRWMLETPLPEPLALAISNGYRQLGDNVAVAVRSSATAEDLPEASFAGQQETLLNVTGVDAVLNAVKQVFASLYNDRAIAYRVHQGFDHRDVLLSVGIQRMARSDCGAAGVLFTLDTESGFDGAIFVTSAWGLGEMVVQGAVNPDEFYLAKGNLRAQRPAILSRKLGSKLERMVYAEPGSSETVRIEAVEPEHSRRYSLSDAQLEELGRQALIIEQHYGRPMDIEWALDGTDGQLYILQARPETVKSRTNAATTQQRYRLLERGAVLTHGRAIGQRIGSGLVRLVKDASEMNQVAPGDVLVTDMTDPDWEPVMKRAAAIVTNRGGRTCHAAIIARELGIPAIVGCGNATQLLHSGQAVTVNCAEGDTGLVLEGQLRFDIETQQTTAPSNLPLKVMINLGNPGRAMEMSHIPCDGIGLARLEFIINNLIGIHPRALLEYDQQEAALRQQIDQRIAGYADPVAFFVDKLSEGLATLAYAFAPRPVIVRLSDFKSNEYASLLGGAAYEPHEENPMIGFRGASRYLSQDFRPCFELECRALKRVREEMGLSNIEIMIPFTRTLEEAAQVVDLLAANGLQRGVNGLRLILMCELPANVILAEEFLHYFDGFSIGSNDLTQLTLGLDRDSAEVAHLFDERNPAVKRMLSLAIAACRTHNKYVGICGQGPSDYPELAHWLMQEGISSLSLNPDSVQQVWQRLSAPEDSDQAQAG